jgi:hypothetical protein
MAVVIDKSTMIANRDATPKILTDAYVANGEVLEAEGYVAPASGDSAGSQYKLVSMPSNARLSSLILQCTALGGAAAIDVGVFWPTTLVGGGGLNPANAGLAIAENFFVAAQSVVTALGPTEVENQSGSYTIPKQELPLWQAIGMAADPGIDLDIVASVNVAIGANGFLGLKARYVKQ